MHRNLSITLKSNKYTKQYSILQNIYKILSLQNNMTVIMIIRITVVVVVSHIYMYV